MTTTGTTWTEETVNAADTPLQLVTGGDGEPLLIIHDELGHQAWLNYQGDAGQELQALYSVSSGLRDHSGIALDYEHEGHGRLVPSWPWTIWGWAR